MTFSETEEALLDEMWWLMAELNDRQLKVVNRLTQGMLAWRSDVSTKHDYGPIEVYHGGEGASDYFQVRARGISVGVKHKHNFGDSVEFLDWLEDCYDYAVEEGHVMRFR